MIFFNMIFTCTSQDGMMPFPFQTGHQRPEGEMGNYEVLLLLLITGNSTV
jgi:hypothetical protein